jgi:hypothetical protein
MSMTPKGHRLDTRGVGGRFPCHLPFITLDTYGHLMPEIQSGAADLMDECVSPVEVVLHQTAPEMHQDCRDTSKGSIFTPRL